MKITISEEEWTKVKDCQGVTFYAGAIIVIPDKEGNPSNDTEDYARNLTEHLHYDNVGIHVGMDFLHMVPKVHIDFEDCEPRCGVSVD